MNDQKVRLLYLTGDNSSKDSNHEHRPIDRAGNARIEGGGVIVWVDHQVGCLAQVSDHQRGVCHGQESQLQRKGNAIRKELWSYAVLPALLQACIYRSYAIRVASWFLLHRPLAVLMQSGCLPVCS